MGTKLKIKKNDTVKVIAGSDKGKTGKVLRVFTDAQRVLVEGVNVRKRHVKATQTSEGGIESKEAPVHYSNVQLVDGKGNATRAGYRFEEKKGKTAKVRFAKTTGEALA